MRMVVFVGLLATNQAWAACPTLAPDRTVCAMSCTDTTIAGAVTAAADDDVICVDPATYTGQIVLNADRVRIESSGPGVRITTGAGAEIIRVENGGDLELIGIDIDGNNQRRCIAVNNSGSSILLDGSDLSGCVQGVDGAGIFLNGAGTSAHIEDSTLVDNGSGGNSGAALFANGASSVEVLRTTVEGGRATSGGAFRLVGTPTTLDEVVFLDNEVSGGRGGSVLIENAALTVLGGSFSAGFSSTEGGCIALDGTASLDVTGTLFDGCDADGDGGAIWHSGSGAVDLSFATFQNGSADLNFSGNGEGGGIFVESAASVLIADTLFQANFAAVGGGLYSLNVVNIDLLRSSFFLNVADDDAGGVYLSSPGAAGLVANNIFELNVCGDDGGGLHVVNGTTTVRNNVFLDNDCPGGGHDGDGVYFENGTSPFRSNVVGYHADEGGRKSGGTVSSDYNLWEANGGGDVNGFAKGGNELSGDPLFVDFTDNGVADDVLVPDVLSPLIDAGDPAFDDLDGSQSDIGAYGGPDAPELDVDGDGSPFPFDCDDADPNAFPGGTELPADSTDGDCDGEEDCFLDADNDGFGSASLMPSTDFDCIGAGIADNPDDCGPADPNQNPDEIEIAGNGVDEDCDGDEACFEDLDDDGFGSDVLVPDSDLDCTNDPGQSDLDGDCDDQEPDAFPGGPEVPADGIDGDCDTEEDCFVDGDADDYGGTATSGSSAFDCDAPGFADNDLDCDDGDSDFNPDATELVANGVDEDCDGGDTCHVDTDGDTYGDEILTEAGDDLDCADLGEAANDDDCNNSNPAIHPGAVELVANGIDEDCDDGDTCFADGDGDGAAGSSSTIGSDDLDCTDDDEFVTATDCNDNDPSRFPGNFETPANGIDEDCDGVESCFDDNDGDDFGTVVQDSTDLDCTDAGEAAEGGDCNDDSTAFFPQAPEIVADGLDQSCDGSELCYADLDFDGFGQTTTVSSTTLTCDTSGVSDNDTDCNDGRATAHPGAIEVVANGIDESCDGVELCWRDVDGDGFGTPLSTVTNGDLDCNDADESAFDEDCNDADVDVNPDAIELVNDGIDQTCDGFELCFQDLDGDTFGRTSTQASSALSCNAVGVANDATDCDDGDAGSFPGAPEVPDDGDDQDCNGDDTVSCFRDDDQDGYGEGAVQLASDGTCDLAANEADSGDDCDDGDDTIHPLATEIRGDGIDQDCSDGDLVDCYEDLDDDGFGHFPPVILPFSGDCGPEPGMSDNAADCDDGDGLVFPGAFDICGDGVDTDCSGEFDDDGDGLDFQEEEAYGTDDCNADSDFDLADDRAEVLAGTDPLDDDSDDDTLLDGEEFGGVVPVDTDSDGDVDPLDDDDDDDLVPTADEAGISGGDHDGDTVPNHLDDDDDGDTVLTALEDLDGDGDPQNDDTDGDTDANWIDDDDDDDGVPTAVEVAIPGANPIAIDSDGDTVLDGVEIGAGGIPTDTDEDGAPDIADPDDDNDTIGTLFEGTADVDGDTLPNYQDLDSDGDGKSDEVEFPLGDTDGDLVPDWLDANDGDGGDGDVDHDGLVTRDEFTLGSFPDDPDTDEDGVPDGTEVPLPAAPLDTDLDLVLDLFDTDDDQDGVTTRDETGVLCADGTPSYTLSANVFGLVVDCPDEEPPPALVFKDTDEDAVPNYLDVDDDGDGVLTLDEDTNGNGDPFDDDQDGDLIPDFDDPRDQDGPLGDLDGDTLDNTLEESQGSDPYSDDTDGDGVLDPDELGDFDEDGITDFEDPDDDEDGIPTLEEGQSDTDGDGIPDYHDTDSDGDGITDRSEDPGDTDCDGLPERVDAEQGTACEEDPVGGSQVYQRQACGCDGTGGGGGWAFVAALLALGRRFSRRR